MDILLNFSGGIDSTWCLWNYLKENPHNRLLVHHCTLRNWEGRGDVEDQAVADTLQWMDDHGMSNYKYINTTFDYGDIPRVVKDKEVIGFLNGIILRDPHFDDITDIIISSNKEDVSREQYYERTESKRFDVLFAVSNRDVNFTYPIREMPRKELMDTMPDDLLDLTWYCRQPEDNQPCGSCKTCLQVKKVES